ncbi:hypothetical protein DS901_03635 [Loktanella sp. D2R18]|uniref:DUF983 domain-containing protein n=1 Tax=Rhodobacterales TaxID=204455 RepID=UPI000DE9883D|nr:MULTISPECIES: DUF983 domain-containing protein [Rhodobacterales]MDO6589251.1 DUF983 domain-containing protein [Yoonia sp. 1_MG-2023]RBW45325.1 hypothetical protein DS901_03635 [Loktanella sp. D2R18]
MSDAHTFPTERPTKPAILRGLRCKCPNCGEASIFDGYLKVVDHCPACNETLSHHRADDGPAYLTILLVAHIIGFAIHFMWVMWEPSPMVMATTLSVGSVALSLFLLPRLKGMIVAIQWARRMHGFGQDG